MLGWPKRCKLAHALLWEYAYKRLMLAQLLGQPDSHFREVDIRADQRGPIRGKRGDFPHTALIYMKIPMHERVEQPSYSFAANGSSGSRFSRFFSSTAPWMAPWRATASLGFGGIVISEKEAPNMLVNLV